MPDFVVGLLAVTVGALFCFRGFMTMRIIIPIWGAFTGFLLGAGLVSSITDDGFLGSALAWFVGVGFALLFGAIAYLYFEVSVMVAMAAVGFAIGTSIMVAIGVTWSWLIVLAGVSLGLVLAVVAIVGDLPTVLLVVLTALGGSSSIVFGLMLWTGALESADIDSVLATQQVDDDWWWYALYVGLAVTGIVLQFRTADRLSATMRQDWVDAGGRQLRAS